MKALTETIIGLFDLAEAEGKLLQQRIVQTFGVVLLMLVAAVMVIIANALFMSALYYFLIIYWSPPSALLAVGVVCLFLAGVSLWIAKRTQQQK